MLMSNPNKMLSNRNLLPLYKQDHLYDNSKEINIGRQNKLILECIMKKEFLSNESVTSFLLHNPEFLESFLMKYYSASNLIRILNKMTNESTEIVYIPRKSDIVNLSRIKSDNIRAKEDQTASISLTSIDSADFLEQKSDEFDNAVLDRELLPNKINPGCDGVGHKKSHQQIVLQHLPSLSQKYLVSPNEISELNLDIKSSTLHLLNEMKNDLLSILHCDGAAFYSIDLCKNQIYICDPEKSSIQTIETGTTLAAYVAQKKLLVNTPDIFMDDRFPLGILMNNSFIKSAIAQPIILNTGEPIGVLELHRSVASLPFSKKDEEVFQNYCTWACLAIYYNEIKLTNEKQQKLNRFILNVTQKMFGKFKNIDSIIKEIMASAKSLVKADRVTLFLLEKTTDELFAKIFDKGTFERCVFETTESIIRFKSGEGIAGFVAATGQTLNIQDAYSDPRFNRNIDSITGYKTSSILCMPVKLKKEVIGVVQMLNKKGGVFTSSDEDDFETFATYCGLALHISKMYEKILRSEQKYKVALDVLSYHSCFSYEDFDKLKHTKLPEVVENLNKLSFWPWSVGPDKQSTYVIYMFKDLFGLELMKFRNKLSYDDSFIEFDQRFDSDTLMRFVLTVKKNYRVVPYHNWNHAFSVAHAMYALLKTSSYNFTIYESLALFIGCLCHDLDHRGKTNEFMVQSSAPLSVLYSTSTMEHHHFNMTVTILQRDGHNIFKHLSPQFYKMVLSNIKHCIISTDLSKYFEYRQIIEKLPNFVDKTLHSNRLLHMALSMTFCDLCSMFKSWDMQLAVVMTIMQEFWTQGDEEKLKGLEPLSLMNRNYKLELPNSQVGFLSYVCLPCYKTISQIMPETRSIIEEAQNNLAKWTTLSHLPEEEKAIKLEELESYVKMIIAENHLNIHMN